MRSRAADFGLGAWSRACGDKEVGNGIAAEVMAKNLERSGGVVEGPSDFGERQFIDEIGSQSLVDTLLESAGSGRSGGIAKVFGTPKPMHQQYHSKHIASIMVWVLQGLDVAQDTYLWA